MSQNETIPDLEKVPAGTVLAVEKTPVFQVVTVKEGVVAVSRTVRGRPVPIMELMGPCFIGLIESYGDHEHWATYTALTECSVKRSEPARVHQFFVDPAHPERMLAPLRLLSRLFRPLIERIAELETNASYQNLMPEVVFEKTTASGELDTESVRKRTPTQTLVSGGTLPADELSTVIVELIDEDDEPR